MSYRESVYQLMSLYILKPRNSFWKEEVLKETDKGSIFCKVSFSKIHPPKRNSSPDIPNFNSNYKKTHKKLTENELENDIDNMFDQMITKYHQRNKTYAVPDAANETVLAGQTQDTDEDATQTPSQENENLIEKTQLQDERYEGTNKDIIEI